MGRCLPQGPAARPRCPCVLRGGRTRRQELHRTRAHPPPLPDPKTLPRSTPTTLLARPPQQPPPPAPGRLTAAPPSPHPCTPLGLSPSSFRGWGCREDARLCRTWGPLPLSNLPTPHPPSPLHRGALLTLLLPPGRCAPPPRALCVSARRHQSWRQPEVYEAQVPRSRPHSI